jgi:hypothetical protein
MNFFISVLVFLSVVTSSYAYQKSTAPTKTITTGITGQVYAVGAPAVRIDWTPPPLERVSTIVITDTSDNVVKEIKTDVKGKFKTPLNPGVYYILVKESMVQKKDGPFTVRKKRMTKARVSFDNGVR